MNVGTLSVRERLGSGPTRGLGSTHDIVAEAMDSDDVVRELVDALGDRRRLVAIRAANALDKVQRVRPEVVTKHGHKILMASLRCQDIRTRWNLVEVVGRLPLRGRDRDLAIDMMYEALGSSSGFLKALAMTSLLQYARAAPALLPRVRMVVEKALDDPSPSTRARARKLWAEITKPKTRK